MLLIKCFYIFLKKSQILISWSKQIYPKSLIILNNIHLVKFYIPFNCEISKLLYGSKMKLDSIVFETSMSTIGFGSSNNMLDGFFIVPSSDLPLTTYVCFIFLMRFFCAHPLSSVGDFIYLFIWVSVRWVLERCLTDGEACVRRNNHTRLFLLRYHCRCWFSC